MAIVNSHQGANDMPTPSRTSVDEIVAAGRAVLESDGLDGLTMQRVATAVGVRAPSLYKRVPGRSALIRLIADDIARELTVAIDAAASTGDPRRDLRAIAEAYRTFALAHPASFGLLYANLPAEMRVDPELNTRASEALLRVVGGLAGEERTLEAARTVVAWANGFLAMELAGAFRLGGDVDRAFDYGIDRITAAIEA
jgi:AcrR family transcriptional regulator